MTEEQIKHLARLAEIYLSEDDLSRIKEEFNEVLDFVSRLQEINTESIEPMYTPIESLSLDYTRNTNTKIDEKICCENVPHEVENNMIVIKSSTVEH